MEYQIFDLRTESAKPIVASGPSPQAAASFVLNLKLVRAGSPKRLVCKAYWEEAGKRNMVRLYQPLQ